jgi:predicted nucleotidyltransferase
VLRPILACGWIEKTNTMAPMEFDVLVNQLVTDVGLRKEIDQLLERKKAGEELKEEPRIPMLNNFLERQIAYYREYCKTLDFREQPVTEVLNRLFRETLKEVWR